MPGVELLRTRVILSEFSFAELIVWRLPAPVAGSTHRLKYRLAYVVHERCVLRYDNESGKGDHRHEGRVEHKYRFSTVEKLIEDFEADIQRWNRENRDS
ncbi:MAG: hypothetical protein JSS46_10200 [Proteobacteria bacterium]|jgi:hypothetical protein|nr:hypothetical protein [Pseudomonadota bacterium]